MHKSRRMQAYYYGFEETEVGNIDKILSAVACAGKAYHHTDNWIDECRPYEDDFTGSCPIDWIQNSAIEAADEVKALQAKVEALEGAMRGFACGLKNMGNGMWCVDEESVAAFMGMIPETEEVSDECWR